MDAKKKQAALHWAELFDSWRVVPRIVLFGYWITVFKLIFWLFDWYMHLGINDRGNQESGLVGVTIATLIGFGKMIYSDYVAHGRDWNQQPVSSNPPTVQP